MAAQLSVPDWLVPPSQAESKRLSLLEDQVKSKAVQMLRKQVGMAKMKSEAEELKKGGLDELTARKTALLNNADLLFADNPEAIANLQRNEEAMAIRERAQEQTLEYRNRMATVAEERMKEIQTHNMELEDARRQKLISDDEYRAAQQELKVKDQELGLLKTQAEIAHRKALEASTKENTEIRRESNDLKRQKMIEEDMTLKTLEMRLKSTDEQLKAPKGMLETKGRYEARVARLEKEKTDLEAQVAKRRNALGGKNTPTLEPAATPKKVLRYDPATKSLVE